MNHDSYSAQLSLKSNLKLLFSDHSMLRPEQKADKDIQK